MDAMKYWESLGKDKKVFTAFCEKVGTSYNYWKHIANRRKRPSVDLARRMVEHSNGALTLEELLPPKNAMRPAK